MSERMTFRNSIQQISICFAEKLWWSCPCLDRAGRPAWPLCRWTVRCSLWGL